MAVCRTIGVTLPDCFLMFVRFVKIVPLDGVFWCHLSWWGISLVSFLWKDSVVSFFQRHGCYS